MKNSFKKNRGFSLIEISIVVGIIGLLAAVTMPTFSLSRQKARDAQRMSDLGRIKVALETFYMHKGYYPPSLCGWDCNGYSHSYSSSWDTLGSYLVDYLPDGLPKDPKNDSCAPWSTTSECYSYAYGNVGKEVYSAQYDLTARLEYKEHPFRCEIKKYNFYFNNTIPWCGSYPKYLYEASK